MRVSVEPALAGLDGEEGRPLAGVRGDDEQVGGRAVQHELLGAGQPPAALVVASTAVASTAVAGGPRGRRQLVERPEPGRLGDRERGRGLARRDAGQVGLGGYLVAGREDGARRQHRRREERARRQGAAHLLEHHLELGEAEPVAAVLLGERQAGQAELSGHLPPEVLVVAALGLDCGAHLHLARLRREEVADAVAKLG